MQEISFYNHCYKWKFICDMAIFVFKMIKPQIQAMLRIYVKQLWRAEFILSLVVRTEGQKETNYGILYVLWYSIGPLSHVTNTIWQTKDGFGTSFLRVWVHLKEKVNQWKWLDCEVADTYVRLIGWEVLKLRILNWRTGNNPQRDSFSDLLYRAFFSF